MTREDGIQSGPNRDALLTQGSEVRANRTEGISAVQAAETAGDLLLDLEHANVAFSEIVVEWYPEIIDRGKMILP